MTAPAPGPSVWNDAVLAAVLFAIDPAAVGGVVVRGGPGPLRDRWLALARSLLPAEAPMRRAPIHIEDDRLLGGLDLAATLAAGRPVARRGLLAECDGGVVILPMAERIGGAVAAHVGAALDRGEVTVERDGMAAVLPARIGVIAFDEGVEDDERPPAALLERLAFPIDLGAVGFGDADAEAPTPERVSTARRTLAAVTPPSASVIEALCRTAAALGLASARAPLLALRVARAHAALEGRVRIAPQDAATAVRLVLAPRAATAPDDPAPPADQPPDPGEPPPTADPRDNEPSSDHDVDPDTDMIIAAITAALPSGLLDRLATDGVARARAALTRGSGARAKAARRGRPVGSRAGTRRAGDALNLVETLRAAAPWQKLRGTGEPSRRVSVRQEDFRIRKFAQRVESTTIIVVDASGSSALQRLAEAKGAVELLLARAYVSRTRVALIAFRGTTADLLLPPTRSLTRAKRRLAELPGGGATPLAAGMDAGLRMALAERAMDRTPMLVFLTDGRANIGRGGAPGRAAAEEDALGAARRVAEARVASAYIDTSPRPRPDGDRFARAMGGVYAPLPYVDAGSLFGLVDRLGRSAP